MAKELSAAEVANLIQKDKEKPKGSRGKKKDFSDRSLSNWFTLPHHFGTCSNEDCKSPKERGGRNRMVSDIDGTEMCRICFTGGYNG